MDFKMLSAICFNLDQSKILSSGNGLTLSLLMMTQGAFVDSVKIRQHRTCNLIADLHCPHFHSRL